MKVAPLLVLVEGAARAHTLGISSGEYALTGARVHARIALAIPDALTLVPSLDADRDRRVSALEATHARAAVAEALPALVRITADGAPCVPSLVDAAPTEEDGFLLEADFSCPSSPREVVVEAPFVAALGEGHRHVARTVGAATTDTLVSAAASRVVFRAPEADAIAPPASTPSKAPFVLGAILAIVGAALLLAKKKAPPKDPPAAP